MSESDQNEGLQEIVVNGVVHAGTVSVVHTERGQVMYTDNTIVIRSSIARPEEKRKITDET